MTRSARISFLAAVAGIVWLAAPMRLMNRSLNHALALFVIWAVLVALGAGILCASRRLWIGVVGCVPFFLAATLYVLLLMGSMIAGGPFVIYEEVDAVRLPNSRIVAYRGNGGATVAFTMDVVQELPVFPGIVLVKDLHRGYDEVSATLRKSRNDTVSATIDGKTTEYQVRPLIYF
jgi:hypothetical protein